MSLSDDFQRLTGRTMQPDLLAMWAVKNRSRIIEALEMDDLTRNPQRSRADEPELPLGLTA